MSFSAAFIAKIRDRTNLPKLVSQYLELKHSNKKYITYCPFHDEKTPSFHVFTDHYHCFGCGAHGDAIAFLKNHCNMNFVDAVKYLAAGNGIRLEEEGGYSKSSKELSHNAQMTLVSHPSSLWIKQATSLLEQCHKRLLKKPFLLEKDKPRGLSLESIERFKLGWQHENLYLPRSDWGLAQEIKNDGSLKKLYVPKGIVIPYHDDKGAVVKLKIRRDSWTPKDKFPKYHILEGSSNMPNIFGHSNEIFTIVEAELDAMLTVQETGDLCSVYATGGASNKPDSLLCHKLKQAKLILYALDFDQAGEKAFTWWQQQFPNLRPWPVPIGKSPCDAWNKGVSLRRWINEGLKYYVTKIA